MSGGRHLHPGDQEHPGFAVAAWLLWLPLRALATRLGRRLATVAVLTTMLVGLMTVLYEHADPPAAGARQRPGGSAAGAPAPGAAGGPGRAATTPGRPGRQALPGPPRAAAATAAQAAQGWYAARLGLPTGQVRALASQRLGPGTARVLVAAQTTPTRLATTWVTVHHTPHGWTVTP